MSVMRSVLPVVFCLLFSLCCWRIAAAQTSSPKPLAAPERYSRVRINLAPQGTLIKLTMLGVLDHALREKQSLITELSDTDLAVLENAGIAFEVIHSDMAKVYETELAAASKKRAMRAQSTPVNFEFGAMSGYSTFDEAVAQLDAMRGIYPSLASDKARIGTSIEGRPMWAVRLGSPQSAGKPQVLYTSLHHAREPGGLMSNLYTMWWLLENYGVHPDATFILDTRELWFVPVVNPDGYEYNRATAPAGGGLWRKNRRNNGDGTTGVDLNRNYGPVESWNSPLGGSSTSTGSDIYRGIAPFSEPETDSLRKFCATKTFRAALNYHTYGNYLIYPYGYSQQESPDSLLFRRFAEQMTTTNGYKYGTDQQTVGYSTRGNSDDWMYGDVSQKPKIFTMTPEIGSIGFWPASTDIILNCEQNLPANLFLAKASGVFIHAATDVASLPTGQPVNLVLTYTNNGIEASGGFSSTLSSSDPRVSISQGTASFGALASQAETDNGAMPFTVQLGGTVAAGEPVTLVVRTEQGNNSNVLFDTLTFVAGTPVATFSDGAESLLQWTGSWGITTESAHSGAASITDSPNTIYSNNASKYITIATPLNLTAIAGNRLTLEYYARWRDIESDYDWCQVQASTDGGSTWQPLKATRMVQGSTITSPGTQYIDQFGYEGSQNRWQRESIDLESFRSSSNFLFRFAMLSDPGTTGDGFYFDDVRVITYSNTSAAPSDAGKATAFLLAQNYPNPFNPKTVVSYQLPAASEVSLKVFDVLGREVATLVNAKQGAGKHSVNFNAANLSSGVYFYRLSARSSGTLSTATRKMLIIK